MKTVCAFARGAVVASAIAATGSAFAQSGDVNVYTYRESKLIQPLFDAFTRDTGVKVNVISASSGLEQRIKAEGANSPADVLLTVDIGRIEDAVRAGITQPIKSEVLDKIVAPQYRDPEGHWYGISMRARGLCLEGPREGDRPELRRPRRSEVEGQDLHPLRPVYLQQRAVCGLHRPSRRSQDRRMAQRPQSQSRAGRSPGVKLGLMKSIASTREPGSGPLCPGLVPQEARTRDKTVAPSPVQRTAGRFWGRARAPIAALASPCAQVGMAEAPRGRPDGNRNFAHDHAGPRDHLGVRARSRYRASAGRSHRMDCPRVRCAPAWRAPGITPATI